MFVRANRLIRALLDAGGLGTLTEDDIVKNAEQIAAASGGIHGMGRISTEERALLARLASDLKKRP